MRRFGVTPGAVLDGFTSVLRDLIGGVGSDTLLVRVSASGPAFVMHKGLP